LQRIETSLIDHGRSHLINSNTSWRFSQADENEDENDHIEKKWEKEEKTK
jgi:hypothetical protein